MGQPGFIKDAVLGKNVRQREKKEKRAPFLFCLVRVHGVREWRRKKKRKRFFVSRLRSLSAMTTGPSVFFP